MYLNTWSFLKNCDAVLTHLETGKVRVKVPATNEELLDCIHLLEGGRARENKTELACLPKSKREMVCKVEYMEREAEEAHSSLLRNSLRLTHPGSTH